MNIQKFQLARPASRCWYLAWGAFALLQILNSTQAMARAMEPNAVKAAVETWVQNLTGDGRPGVTITSLIPFLEGNDTVAYIAKLSDSGFCLCGADNDVAPVYLYVPQGEYSADNRDVKYVLREIADRTKYFRQARASSSPALAAMQASLAERAEYWNSLTKRLAPRKQKVLSPESVPSMMDLNFTSQWDQVSPWNLRCPELEPGLSPPDLTYVGCVATAMAQTMYYWKWPSSGTGSDQVEYHYKYRTNLDQTACPIDPGFSSVFDGRLQWSNASGGVLGMTGYWDQSLLDEAKKLFAHPYYQVALQALYDRLTNSAVDYEFTDYSGPYDWSAMEDTAYWDGVKNTMGSAAADNAVALICNDAGIGAGMNYGVMGSAAHVCGYAGKDALDALENHFRYDDDAYCTSATVTDIANEIHWLRPVIIAGDIPGEAGHCWVAIGYDRNTSPDRILMNMGWGGLGDAWYTLDSLPLGLIKNDVIANLAPEGVVRFVGGTIDAGDGTPDDPYMGLDEAVIEAPSGATLIYAAGWTDNLLSNPIVISKKLLIKGKNVVIQ